MGLVSLESLIQVGGGGAALKLAEGWEDRLWGGGEGRWGQGEVVGRG